MLQCLFFVVMFFFGVGGPRGGWSCCFAFLRWVGDYLIQVLAVACNYLLKFYCGLRFYSFSRIICPYAGMYARTNRMIPVQ